MVLSRLTKITGPGIRTDTNWVGNNANYTGILTAVSLGGIGNITATGIITASSFSGDGSGLIGVASTDNIITGTAATFNTYPVDINAGMTVAGVATFAGNVSIAGTLTYEDVTNIDSVGIITGKGADINGDLDVDGHTNLDNVSIAGVVTTTDLTVEKSGNLNVNIKSTGGWGALEVGGATAGYIDIKKPFSDDFDLRLMVDGSGTNYISSNAANLKLDAQGNNGIELGAYGAPSLKYNNDTKLTTTIKGIQVGTGVTIETNGQATFVGIVTFGSSSTTINGNTDTVNVGTALTIGHSQGLQYHTQNLHAQGFEVNQINASGIITATTFSGSGASLTNLPSAQLTGALPAISGASLTNLNGSNIASGTVPVARIGTGTKNTSTFYRGDGTFATVTAPAITAINSASNNRIVTSDGGTTVTAESNLIFDGATLKVGNTESPSNYNSGADNIMIGNHSGHGGITILSGTSSGGFIMFSDNNGGSANAYRGQIEYQHGGSDADHMRFLTDSTEHLRIRSEGQLMISGADTTGSTDMKHGSESGGGDSNSIYINRANSTFDWRGGMVMRGVGGSWGLRISAQGAMNTSSDTDGEIFGVHPVEPTNPTNAQSTRSDAVTDAYFRVMGNAEIFATVPITQSGSRPFYLNSTAVTSNETITTTYNAMSVGNISINSGNSVTVQSGARWVIV